MNFTRFFSSKTAFESLTVNNFKMFLCWLTFNTLASRTLAVVIGFQIYSISRSTLALGMLGLIEAVPAVGLALFGGHFADQMSRRKILLFTCSASVVAGALLALVSSDVERFGVLPLYAIIFLVGIARAFADPAAGALEAQIVPRSLVVNASTWASTMWLTCAIIGPAAAGFMFGFLGAIKTYLIIASSFLISLAFIYKIQEEPVLDQPNNVVAQKESIFKSIREGVSYVFKHQALWGSMVLDLFAILFGGATALFPVFALDILHVGAKGLGFLAAAPSLGALLVMMIAMHRPPKKYAGKILLGAVAGFGVSMVVFGLSRNFVLSLVALVFSGIFDGISVVVRRSIVRLMSPDHLRGRIAAVSWIFIGSSNEIGAFESGSVATLVGAAPAVWGGGIVTILIVFIVFKFAPKLTNLQLE